MIFNSVSNFNNKKFDYIIIGAGTVGLYLAAKLDMCGKNILVLENGSIRPDEEILRENFAINLGRKHEGAWSGRARQLGGTSTLWGGQLVPFSDFDFRGKSKRPKWIIDYEEMEFWYKKVAEKLELETYLIGQDGLRKHFYGKNKVETDDCEVFFTHWLKQPNFAKFFKNNIEKTNSLNICLNSKVFGFDGSNEDGEIDKIYVRDVNSKEDYVVNGGKIIFACGTMEISRLLLSSARKNKKLPWSGNYLIGKYFQDHLDVNCAKIVINNKEKFNTIFDNCRYRGNKLQPKIKIKEKVYVNNKEINLAGAIDINRKLGESLDGIRHIAKSFLNLNLKLSDYKVVFSILKVFLKTWVPLIKRYIIDKRVLSNLEGGAQLRVHCEQLAILESSLSLDVDNETLVIKWELSDLEHIDAIYLFNKSVDEFLRKENLGYLVIDEKLKNRNVDFLSNARDSFHQCGGTIMSSGIEDGVVDLNCRIHGSKNCYIVGAAVFPRSSFANPTFTALALTERLSEYLNAEA